MSVCAHSYAQIIGDARRGKMPDDHRPLAQCGGQRRARMRRMAREYEVGGGRQNLKAKPDQSTVKPVAAFDDACARLAKIGLVLERGDGAGPADRN